jgi:hypothetical protein
MLSLLVIEQAYECVLNGNSILRWPNRSTTNGFGALDSGDLAPQPPTTLTEAFMATQTDVLQQFMQTQQQLAQQLQQMQLMQPKPRSLEPCPPRVPTQTDMNTIVGAIQMLEGQNSVLSQIVYDIIKVITEGYLKLLWQTISLRHYLHPWSSTPACLICWWIM